MAARRAGLAPRGRSPAGYLLGFAFGGFFDGILLHQILRWHHLLSAVESPAFKDLQVQILADGLFHAAMYVVAAYGSWRLWRDGDRHGSGRQLAGSVLLGFAAWHVVDTLVSHWLLGIHRVRMDTANPLAWDLAWLVGFGLLPAALGWWLARAPGPPGGQRRAAAGLSAAVLAAAVVAAVPLPAAGGTVIAFFRPGAGTGAVFRAAAAVDGRVIWSDPAGRIAALRVAPGTGTASLRREGVWLVSRTLGGIGCAAWLRG